MSRSYKKPWYCDSSKFSKRLANKVTRRFKGVIAQGKSYRKLFCSYNICDFKFFAPEDPKSQRK